jgi:hypothetical protein
MGCIKICKIFHPYHFLLSLIPVLHPLFLSSTLLPQAFGYTLWFSLFSLKLNIFPFSASILTLSTQNHLILKYFTNFDTTHRVTTLSFYKLLCLGPDAVLLIYYKLLFLGPDAVLLIYIYISNTASGPRNKSL